VKAEQAKALGFNEVIDTSFEKLDDGVSRITGGYGADIVIDGVGGEVLSEALGALALNGMSMFEHYISYLYMSEV
jgi:NADPH:quinone reductase